MSWGALGRLIRDRRNAMGATLREIAGATGQAHATISRAERGQHQPPFVDGWLLLRAVGVTAVEISRLVEGLDEGPAELVEWEIRQGWPSLDLVARHGWWLYRVPRADTVGGDFPGCWHHHWLTVRDGQIWRPGAGVPLTEEWRSAVEVLPTNLDGVPIGWHHLGAAAPMEAR